MISMIRARQELAEVRRGLNKDFTLLRHQGPIIERAGQIMADRRVTVDQALDEALNEFVGA